MTPKNRGQGFEGSRVRGVDASDPRTLEPLNPRTLPRVVALVGPTASGKTELGIALAERFGAEIVNADSRQVYRRLEVGSAKPTFAQRARVAHHLIDVAEPDEAFDCARYRQLALAAIADIRARGRRVLVVGGTGLYVKVLLRGVFEGPPRQPILRTALEQEERSAPGSLHRRLSAVDPEAAAHLHHNDRVRLIRALEVYELTGKPISVWQHEHRFQQRLFDTLMLALALPRAELYARINARCDEMLAGGLLAEVRQLLAAGVESNAAALQSPGYREVVEYLTGHGDLESARRRMAQATRRLAKRQLTWFRGDAEVQWCAPSFAELEARIEAFWNPDPETGQLP